MVKISWNSCRINEPPTDNAQQITKCFLKTLISLFFMKVSGVQFVLARGMIQLAIHSRPVDFNNYIIQDRN